MQTPRGASSAENCTCDEDAGYTWQQASAENMTRVPMPTSASGRCLKFRGNITAAKEAASAFSTVLATGVAASVAASVVAGATIGGGVSGIASFAGGSAGAITGAPLSSAGSAGGSRLMSANPSSGSAWVLIDQIQLMNQLGAAQGVDASQQALAAFCSDFSWANYDLAFLPLFSSSGEAPIQRNTDGTSADANPFCRWEEGYKMSKRVVTCAGILVLVYVLREACRRIYMARNPEEPSPPDMTFPAWEASRCAQRRPRTEVER